MVLDPEYLLKVFLLVFEAERPSYFYFLRFWVSDLDQPADVTSVSCVAGVCVHQRSLELLLLKFYGLDGPFSDLF